MALINLETKIPGNEYFIIMSIIMRQLVFIRSLTTLYEVKPLSTGVAGWDRARHRHSFEC